MPEPFEIRAELDEGFAIEGDTTRAWIGARIRYRPLGSRGRFRTFLLEYEQQPTLEQLQKVCAEHERRSA